MPGESLKFETMVAGLQFPEGPIAMDDGSVVLVEIRRQTLTRVGADGRSDVIAHLGGGRSEERRVGKEC